MSNQIINRRNDEIEVLRAVSILFVIFGHLPNLLFWGSSLHKVVTDKLAFWGGVDLFFCISGFVIGRTLWEKHDSSRGIDYWKEVVAFWIRRAYRIIPSAWLWLLVVLLCTVVANRSLAFGYFWGNLADTIASVLYFQNFHFASCLAEIGLHVCGNNGIYWSLSLEEQFYLFCPLIFLLPRKAIIGTLLFLIAIQLPFGRMETQQRLWFFARTDAISLGVLLAWISNTGAYANFEPKVLANGGIRWFVFFILTFAIVFIPGGTGLVNFQPGLIALVSVVLVFIASYDQGYLMRACPLRTLLSWVGSRSFAIYLIHNPAYWLTHELWYRIMPEGTSFNGTYSLRFLLTAFFLIVVFSEMNYRFVETPFRLRGRAKSAQLVANTI